MPVFRDCTVLLPVIDETNSLKQTVDIIRSTCDPDIRDYIALLCSKTTLQSRAICEKYCKEIGERFRIHDQKKPFIGGAIQEGFELATGSHVLMMATDLETDPRDVPRFIEEARKAPEAVITASRWIGGVKFEGYNPVKFLANHIFQKLFSLLYRAQLTDFTFAYSLFPVSVVRAIRWEEYRHPFFLETKVKPLRLGIPVIEIPSGWKARTEGASRNTFFRNFQYFGIGLRVLFYSREKLLRQGKAL
jgi:hypothetical protein